MSSIEIVIGDTAENLSENVYSRLNHGTAESKVLVGLDASVKRLKEIKRQSIYQTIFSIYVIRRVGK